MNILELAGFYSNYGSNFIPTLINLESKLNKLGHKTYFIFSNKNLSKKFLEWEIPFSEKYDTRLLNFSSLSFIKEVVKFIKEKNIKIVHAHFCPSIFLTAIKKKTPKDVLFLEHIHSSPYNNKKTFKAFLKRVRNFIFLDKKILKICVSNSIIPMVQYSFPKQKVVCCQNAIELSRFRESPHNYGCGFTVLLFGYNYFVKGVDIAIKAGVKLHAIYKDFKLNIVMGDNFQKNINSIVEQFGKIPSFVSILEPTHQIDNLYKKNTIFLNASRSEGGSYAVLEAYYSGSLCVISDIPPNLEINLPGAICFKSDNVDDLVLAIKRAFENKDMYNNKTVYIKEMFSVDAWSLEIIGLMGLD